MTDAEPLARLLPWRHPFLMIDRIVDCDRHHRIRTLKMVAGDDLLTLAHRPGRAVFPGVMVLEGMNQSAALLFQLSYGRIDPSRIPLLGFLRAGFPGSAVPGDTIEFTIRAVKMTPSHGLFDGRAAVAGREIAEGELAFAVAAAEAVSGGPGREI